MTVTYLQAFGIYYVSFQLGYFLMYVYNTKCRDLDTPTPKVTKASRKAARTAFMAQPGTPGGSVWAPGASHSPQTDFGWEPEE